MFVGSCDSFVDLNLDGTRQALTKVVGSFSEGIAISVSEHQVEVRDFAGERSIFGGVSRGTRSAYEPVLVSAAICQRSVLQEFEELLKGNAYERILEEFLIAHYKDLFWR